MTERLATFIEQCDVEGERGTWMRPASHPSLCGYCAKPVGIQDYASIISDAPTSVTYPDDRSPFGVRVVLEHSGCGPDVGYNVQLRRLLQDGLHGPRGWVTHLDESKSWCTPGVVAALESAYKLAASLPSPNRVTAPVARPTPSRRTSTNPRSISTRTRARVMERDDFRCRRCGCGPDERKLVVDHIAPVARGGTGDESNLQTLCDLCNAGKADREPHPHDRAAREAENIRDLMEDAFPGEDLRTVFVDVPHRRP